MDKALISAGCSRKAAGMVVVALAVTTLGICPVAHASEIGHFSPGVMNIRDFVVPEPGFYFVVYNFFYMSERLNDRDGNEISSISLGPSGGLTLNVDVNVDVYALAPAFIWVSKLNVLGAKYAAYISPAFNNTSIGASLTTQTGSGRSAETSQYGLGDLFVQPLWLGWSRELWDFALGYGLYAPVGRYNTEMVELPVIGPITTEASDNIGLGFWTHQLQGAVSWYPWEHRGTAVATALTYEIHQKKKDFDLTPGQNLAWNWGISQYLPLKKDESLLLQVGPAGYSSWQITDDSGSDARNPSVHDQVHAAGGQIGLVYAPWKASLDVRYLYEFSAKDRFQGQVLGVNLAIGF